MDDLPAAGGTTDLRESPPMAEEPRRQPAVLPVAWALFAGVIGPVVTAICIALEPVPADPGAAIPALDSLLFLALLAAFGLAAGTALRRQVRALTWAAAATAVAVALSVACPASGHHTDVGAWWYTQMAVAVTALVVATVARARFRSSP